MAKKKQVDATAQTEVSGAAKVTEAEPAPGEIEGALQDEPGRDEISTEEMQAQRTRLCNYHTGQPLGGAYTVYDEDVDAEPVIFPYDGNASAEAHKRALDHAVQRRANGKKACVVMTHSRVVG